MSRVGLTVQISTKPNRSHLVHGKVGLILPTLGRSDRDDAHPGGAQFVTVEDSMSVVHSSRGRLAPVSDRLLAEPVIVCRMARALLGPEHPVDWEAMAADYDVIRDHISRVIPGFENYNERVRVKEGFVLPHPPRDTRSFATASGKAQITVNELSWPQVPEGRLLLQTMRSHDQYNTTIYGLDDRYRGISAGPPGGAGQPGRHHRARPGRPADGGRDQRIRHPGRDRVPAGAENFRVVSYPTAPGCAAAYYPEANVLVPTNSVADESGTPTSKGVIIRLEAAAARSCPTKVGPPASIEDGTENLAARPVFQGRS